MPAGEYTPLRTSVRAQKYEHLDIELDRSGSTTVRLTRTENKADWKVKAVRIAAGIAILLSAVVILARFQESPTAVSPNHHHTVKTLPPRPYNPMEGAAWSAIAQPLSILDPETLGLKAINRPVISMPGAIFGELLEKHVPLPTNSWCENLFLGESNTDSTNRVYQLPYVIDTEVHGNMSTQGVETHPCHVQANENMVEMIYQPRNGITLGSNETFLPQHQVSADTDLALGRLSTVLEWKSQEYTDFRTGPFMKTAIVRGSPYTSMEYKDATPKVTLQRAIKMAPVIDNDESNTLLCGQGEGVFGEPKTVESEVRISFEVSDFTWLIFFSEPTEIVCSSLPEPPAIFYGLGVPPPPNEPHGKFEIMSTKPMHVGMIRVALANNCTEGKNPEYCAELGTPTDNSGYMELLRAHSDVYPTGKADVRFTFPVASEEEEELRLNFNW